jgi:hypothetical protein
MRSAAAGPVQGLSIAFLDEVCKIILYLKQLCLNCCLFKEIQKHAAV